MLAVAAWLPPASAAAQVSWSSEVRGVLYPRDPAGREAIGSEVRGWTSVEFDRPLAKNIDLSGDVVVYGSNERRALVDGELSLAWRGEAVAFTAGLLRDRWGRFTDSPLDPLGPANTPFSLVSPELRLSQPAVKATLFAGGVSVDAYALIGARKQPLPESDGRFGFGVDTRDIARRGHMGDHAVAVRVSGTELNLDWSAHVFGGLSRRPTFVPQFSAAGQLAGMDAVYTEMLQVGGSSRPTVPTGDFSPRDSVAAAPST